MPFFRIFDNLFDYLKKKLEEITTAAKSYKTSDHPHPEIGTVSFSYIFPNILSFVSSLRLNRIDLS